MLAFKNLSLLLLIVISISYSLTTHATIVEFETSQGNFQVNLYDTSTPITVNNFLNYVNDGDYIETVIHRSEPGFVIQGGGFKYDGDESLEAIETNGAIKNEPIYSNVSATIAMAKLPNEKDSATNQWFINLDNNSANLDVQNGGFTVFGQVIGDGMDVVRNISQLPRCNTVPLSDYSTEQCQNNDIPGYENYVTVYNITIIDSNKNTDDGLSKPINTLINEKTPDTDNGSGGSIGWLLILMFLRLSIRFIR